jgi:hypothetical protein
MCRSIKTLHIHDHPATEDEARAAALQYVRKISGYRKPSQANAVAFDAAVNQITAVSLALLGSLTPRDAHSHPKIVTFR